MTTLLVEDLIAAGSELNNSSVEVSGWLIDQFEHRAIYPTKDAGIKRDYSRGISLRGNLPKRKFTRGDGPIHGHRVRVKGKFHWQPKSGAGHMGLFSAWIGVSAIDTDTNNQAEAQALNP